MRPTRRELLTGAGGGLTVGLAGCTGELTAEGAAFAATEARLSAEIQQETGYTHHRTTEDTITRPFERFGFTRRVDVTNVISEYDRAIELGFLGMRLQAAVFAVLSTPQVRILGRAYNPVYEMGPLEIAEMIQERYDEISNVREDRSFEARVAGRSTNVTRFTARARLVEASQGMDVYLYISQAVELGDDFVVTLAVHPMFLGERRGAVETLMDHVSHA